MLLAGLIAIVSLIGWRAYCTFEKDGVLGFNFLGKSFVLYTSTTAVKSAFSPPPYVQQVNEFLTAFIHSTQRDIQFGRGDIQANVVASPMMTPLQGLDYERVLMRLRMISSLEPATNRTPDEGLIRVVLLLPSGSKQEVQLRAAFSADGKSISLSKIGGPI